MSHFSKFLWPITITTSNQTFGYNDGGAATVDIDTGTYDTILEVLANLDTKLGAGWTVEISEIGRVSIAGPVGWTWSHTTTDNALEYILGLFTTDQVSNDVLTARFIHDDGYYPGIVSWGESELKGTAVRSNQRWVPNYAVIRNTAGDNTQVVVGPDSPSETMPLQFGAITVLEASQSDPVGADIAETNTLRYFANQCIASRFRYYPDRALGTVAAPGTQNTDYYLCTLAEGEPVIRDTSLPGQVTFSLVLNKEPTS